MLHSQVKEFGDRFRRSTDTKMEERLFLVILYSTCSDHHGSIKVHSGYHSWRGPLMNLMTSKIPGYGGELMTYTKYSKDQVYIVQREQYTTDIIWLLLSCSVRGDISLDVQWSPWESFFQNAFSRYLMVLLSSFRNNIRGRRWKYNPGLLHPIW